MSRPVTAFLLWAAATFAVSPALAGEAPTQIDATLQRAIQACNPSAEVLRLGDMDEASCTLSAKDTPGLVRADLDGNGHADYATLLRTPKGAGDRNPRISLVVFMADAGGRLTPVVLDAYDYAQPSIEGLARQEPGLVRATEAFDAPGPDQVVLRRPGFARYYCEKSEAVYYWDERGKRFGEIWTAD
jgi:hypothetical protein